MFRALFNPLQRSNVRDYWKKEKKKKNSNRTYLN